MDEYQSSEELQRANRDTFVDKAAQKKAEQEYTERQKLVRVLDKYIGEHAATKKVREMAKESKKVEKYGSDYQLDLSADLVEILEKIKNELR